jgi:hypothetical protein
MNEVQVNATGNLLARNAGLSGDSTNPSSWRIVRNDTNTILSIASVEPNPSVGPSSVILRLLFPLPANTVQLTVGGLNLRDALGGLVLPPTALTFNGLVEVAYASPARAAVTMTGGGVDLLNRQTPTPETSVSGAITTGGNLTGTLVVQGGDYRNQSGNDLLKKLIIRRMTASPGDFIHLPTYGAGLLRRVKSIIPAGELGPLRGVIQQQIQQEPDVQSVSVSLVQTANQLTVQVSVLVRSTGDSLEFGVPFQLQAA